MLVRFILVITGICVLVADVPASATDCDSNGIQDNCDVFTPDIAQDFNGGQSPYLLNGTAILDSGTGAVRLTNNLNSQTGSLVFTDLISIQRNWTVTFKYKAGGGTNPGADGISMVMLPRCNYATAALFGERGPGDYALAVSLDTFQNPGDPSGNFLAVYSGNLYAQYEDGSNAASTSIPTIDDNVWHTAQVIYRFGRVTVSIDGTTYITGVPVRTTGVNAFDQPIGWLAFGARTGGSNNQHWIDDVSVQVDQGPDCDCNAVPDEHEIIPYGNAYSLYFDPFALMDKRKSVKLPNNLFRGTGTTLTIEGWFRCGLNNASMRENGVIIGMNNGDITGDDFPAGVTQWTPVVYVGEDGRLRGKWWNGPSDPITSSLPVDDNRWHHFALAGAVNTQTLYLDGAPVGSLSGTIDHLNEQQNFIGRGKWSQWPAADTPPDVRSFNGKIDEVRFWNIALNQTQVQQGMTTLLTGNESGLVGYWRLNEGSDTVAADIATAGGAQDGTLIQSPQWTAEIGGSDCNVNGIEDICDTVCHGMSHLCTITSAQSCTGLSGCLPMNVFTTCPNPSGMGQQIFLWAQFSPADPTVLTGEVWWYINDERVAVTPVHATNQMNLNYFSEYPTSLSEYEPGPLSIRAVYVGCETDVNSDPIVFIGTTTHTLQVELAPDAPCAPAQWVGTTTVLPSNTVVFGQPVIIRTTWHAPDYDQNPLLGPVNYFRSPNQLDVFRQALKYNVGEDYSATIMSSTIPLGTYNLDVDYIGPEGDIVQNPFTLTVAPPPSPVKIALNPPGLIKREAVAQTIRACVLRLPGMNAPSPTGSIRLRSESAGYDQTLNVGASGCVEFEIGMLPLGSHQLVATYSGDAAHQSGKGESVVVVVPAQAEGLEPLSNETDVIALSNVHETLPAHLNAVKPGVTIQVALGARDVVAPPGALSPFVDCMTGPLYEAAMSSPACLPYDLSDDWNVDMADFAILQQRGQPPTTAPNSLVRVFLNGGLVGMASADGLGAVYAFGPFNLAPGSYVLDAQFDGNETYAASSAKQLLIDTASDPNRIIVLDPETGLSPPQGSANSELLIQVNPAFPVAGRSTFVTGRINVPKSAPIEPGIPDGVLVVKNGSGGGAPLLGRVRLNGYAGTIELPNGLSAGDHTIRLEYYDANETMLLSSAEFALHVYNGSSMVLATAETDPIVAGKPNRLVADVHNPDTQSGAGIGGTVDFYNGEDLIGSANVVNGRAVLVWNAPNNDGTYSLTALFSGDALTPGAWRFSLTVVPPSDAASVAARNLYIMSRLALLAYEFDQDAAPGTGGHIPRLPLPCPTGITRSCTDNNYGEPDCPDLDVPACTPPNSERFVCEQNLETVLNSEFGLDLVTARYRLSKPTETISIAGQLSRLVSSTPSMNLAHLAFRSSFVVAKDDDSLVIAIRGTDGPINDTVNDEGEPGLWKVTENHYIVAHPGWGYMTDRLYDGGFSGFPGIKSIIQANRMGPHGPRQLYIVGHSLGGALSRMVMLKLAIDGLRMPNDRVYTFGAPWTGAYQNWIPKFTGLINFWLGNWIYGYQGREDFDALYEHLGLAGDTTKTIVGRQDRVPPAPEVEVRITWDKKLSRLNKVLEIIEDIVNEIIDFLHEVGGAILDFFGVSIEDGAPPDIDIEVPRPIGYTAPFFISYFNINADPGESDEDRIYHHRIEYQRFGLELLKESNQGFYFPNNNTKVRQPLTIVP